MKEINSNRGEGGGVKEIFVTFERKREAKRDRQRQTEREREEFVSSVFHIAIGCSINFNRKK